MEVRVLGPLEVLDAGRTLPMGGYRQRLVLAVLLLQPDRVVTTDWLVDAVWGEDPPRTARKTLQVYISRLRRVLGADAIEAAPTGYALRLGGDQPDAARFEQLANEGRRLLPIDPAAAARPLHQALSLWRGAPWGELGDEPAIQPEAQRLRERRLVVLEDRIAADLANGHAAGLVGELEGLVEEHPWRERFRGQLMLALYRAGRQADALQAFQSARSFLGEELGIEPSPELRDLEEKILLQDAMLAGPAPSAELEDWRLARNPYKGLRPFRQEDHEDFFGRSDLIDELIDRVEHHRFVAVVGASGSGKSSVVMAGLLPRLRSDDWISATMVPGRDPFQALEAALEEVRPNLQPEVWRGDELDLVRAAHAVAPDGEPSLLLVIDQFEELLHQVTDLASRARFIRNLVEAVEDPVVPVTILITLRADFFHRALEQSPLGELIGSRLVSVLPLRAHELEAAAVLPAQQARVHMEPELIAELIGEMTDQPGALPLFQYVLTQLFEERDGPVLTRSAYRRLGGLTGALSRRAEETFQALTPEAQAIAHQLFMRLATVDAAGVAGRRRVEQASLESLAPNEGTAKDVLTGFDAARLLTFDRHPVTGGATVEVAHEALLREWPRMQGWLDTAQEDLRLHGALIAQVADWEASGRDSDYLLTGSRLDLYQDWEKTTGIDLTDREDAYLEAGNARREAERAEDEIRRGEELRLERRSVRRLRALVVVVSIAALIASGLTLFAAGRSRAAAASEREARARELANASLVNLETDAELALLLAVESIKVTRSVDGFVVAEAEQALQQAVSASRLVAAHEGEWDLGFLPDGSLFVGGPAARVLDPATGETVLALPAPEVGHVEVIAVNPDGTLLATGTYGGGVGRGELAVWDAASGAEVQRFSFENGPAHSRTVWSIAFSPDSRLLASYSWNEEEGVRVWDVASGNLILERLDPDIAIVCCPPVGLAFSPDGSSVAVGAATGDVIIFDVATGEWLPPLTGHEGPVSKIEYLPDGTGIVTSSWDGTVRLWSSEAKELATVEAEVGLIIGMALSDDGRYMLTGGDTGLLRLWELQPGEAEPIATLPGHRAAILNAAFAHDGGVAASVAFDGEVRVWDVSPKGRGEIAAWPGSGPVAFSPDGTMLAFADEQRRDVAVWPVAGGRSQLLLPVAGFIGDAASDEEWADSGSVVFSPDGEYLATTTLTSEAIPSSLTLWDVASGAAQATLFQHPFILGKVAFNDDGSRIAVATCEYAIESSTAAVIEAATGDLVFTTPPGPCGHAADLDPAGELLAVLVNDDRDNVRIWDIATEQLVTQMSHLVATGGSVQFSPDGSRLLTVGADGFGRIWDAGSGELLIELEGHTGGVEDGVWVSDDTVATASSDNTARLWDATSGENVLTLPLDGYLPHLAVSPDGRRLATSSGGVVRVRTLDLDELLAIATERSRPLSPAECVTFHFEDCPSAP
ncbi:MAG: BTAD domain-containing putative transcriptional regulator [Acidimicrobiia bacterium]|nr:BTAD domain-containing putative transcriptional regulator [Acidimicrobiia bacterium]